MFGYQLNVDYLTISVTTAGNHLDKVSREAKLGRRRWGKIFRRKILEGIMCF